MIIADAITLNTTPMIIGVLSSGGSVKKSSFKSYAQTQQTNVITLPHEFKSDSRVGG